MNFIHPDVATAVGALSEQVGPTPWSLEARPDGAYIALDYVDARWTTYLAEQRWKKAFAYEVRLDPAARRYSITDHAQTIEWRAGTAGWVPVVSFEGSAASFSGRQISFSRSYVSVPGQGVIVDSRFSSETERAQIREVLARLGWTEKTSMALTLGIVGLVAGCLGLLSGIAVVAAIVLAR
ncbi:hypothetical protein CLV28_2981 [Sediminihabitans luteus]|uniref:Uncharacterized protein n=1 Tax=Sediminihabitans luteus TaxID=1138585 RepID=A0A2M9CBY1_9CELL|nr:hypothetical protein [Sediminihabitans luteus]PJJ68565.1 hypothetical protein CLV28_2981 [Sediminihabitans luteus]